MKSTVDDTRGQVMGPPNGFLTVMVITGIVGYAGVNVYDQLQTQLPNGRLHLCGLCEPIGSEFLAIGALLLLLTLPLAYRAINDTDE